jgi:hypothetical protein
MGGNSMILPFAQYCDKKKKKSTYFAEKIWLCLVKQVLSFDSIMLLNLNPKIHTIREDKPNRWKAGSIIHAVYGNRTKFRFQFAPLFKCVSTQTIEIVFEPENIYIAIDNRLLNYDKICELAANDGFENISEFFNYFDYKDFTGKIIHFTDFKY